MRPPFLGAVGRFMGRGRPARRACWSDSDCPRVTSRAADLPFVPFGRWTEHFFIKLCDKNPLRPLANGWESGALRHGPAGGTPAPHKRRRWRAIGAKVSF